MLVLVLYYVCEVFSPNERVHLVRVYETWSRISQPMCVGCQWDSDVVSIPNPKTWRMATVVQVEEKLNEAHAHSFSRTRAGFSCRPRTDANPWPGISRLGCFNARTGQNYAVPGTNHWMEMQPCRQLCRVGMGTGFL